MSIPSKEEMTPLKIDQLRSVYDMLSLKGRTAFVTGAAGGIGRSCAAAMAEAGANIIFADLSVTAEKLAENARAIGERYNAKVAFVTGDVSKEDDVRRMYAEAAGMFGSIDIVFSNAGISVPNDNGANIKLADWQRILDVNLTGMMLVDSVGANLMRDQGHGGTIVNTASMSGHIINRRPREAMSEHMMGYAATKAAVLHLTKSIAVNYVEYGIRCNSISPGIVVSGLHDKMDPNRLEGIKAHIPMNRFGTLDEIVGVVLFLASDLSSYVTGTDILVDGGATIW
ncbi:MAG: SDR family oxidoreductase [Clostridiales bacterium]|nr:SDR family oxidoreductase [Clostridiales bacterium]